MVSVFGAVNFVIYFALVLSAWAIITFVLVPLICFIAHKLWNVMIKFKMPPRIKR